MANPDNIVTVNITIQDAAVSQAGFGTPMILTHETAFGPELVRSYGSTTAMVTDGHSASGSTVAAATAIFAQNPKVPTIKVGNRGSTATAQTRIMTVAVVADDTDYTVTINGTAFTVDSGSSATAVSIAALLDAAINAGSEPVTSTDNLDGTFDLVADAAGTLFGLSHTMGLITQDDTSLEDGIATDYAAVKAEDDDFYGVLMTSASTLEIVALAAAVEADRKIFLAQTSDSDVLSDTAGNVAETLNTAGYNRTSLIWNLDNFSYAQAAWMGRLFPKNPGEATWAFKSLAGVSFDVLSDTQISNLEASEANHYTRTKGLSMTLQGTMASGRFIDITRGIDWLTVRMQERILQLLANSDKIPYTQSGITALENEVRAQLAEAASNNVITENFTVTPPNVDDVSAANKAARVLGDLDFSATLAGAIHSVTINGSVSV
jgi:hypothetical protein